jgi:GTP 3',8-cyclase
LLKKLIVFVLKVSSQHNKNITDEIGRSFKTLRISLTNTCNLGCVYCVSAVEEEQQDLPYVSGQEKGNPSLRYDELLPLVKRIHQLSPLGVIRLTGGEPTLYRDLVPLIQGLKQLGIPAIKMTTNGYNLRPKLEALSQAGLSEINISLDAIEPDAFFKVTRRRNLHRILEAIDQAMAFGIQVKINMVVMQGLNVDQILPLLRYALSKPIPVRFLEVMNMGHLHGEGYNRYFVSQDEILDQISKEFKFLPLEREQSATANYWALEGGGVFGIIANESSPFCGDCDRLRLDSFGNIYGCLSENMPVALHTSMDDEEMVNQMKLALSHKQKIKFKGSDLSMLSIGG